MFSRLVESRWIKQLGRPSATGGTLPGVNLDRNSRPLEEDRTPVWRFLEASGDQFETFPRFARHGSA